MCLWILLLNTYTYIYIHICVCLCTAFVIFTLFYFSHTSHQIIIINVFKWINEYNRFALTLHTFIIVPTLQSVHHIYVLKSTLCFTFSAHMYTFTFISLMHGMMHVCARINFWIGMYVCASGGNYHHHHCYSRLIGSDSISNIY